ncbi:Phosphatidylserine/phosphatidylglycerophosphate/cardiolipin synthase [Malonomonas rubra DSM 5091]|uniref:Phosphatidylserine/phosphatidylglycerophosphate/cardiolipin synthase n=1 Tax=Malonomonas rubra DSM 5091 TaxID=1122189 RepID=A0A1M6L448_MALRU|nr:phospholipase D family protein [Malonomonas rubra]SHJ65988.1 Phosphatidylserine/phosphatidylglycerophosphate/cardiolipin synthase [Malonomonas rubra DSM 5091]
MIKAIRYLPLCLMLLLLFGCATLPENIDRPPSKAFINTEDTAIGTAIAKQTVKHPEKSGFLLLEDGLDAFVGRAVLARFAQRSIDVQYYLYHDDLVGRLFTNLLVKAADRGVRVRLLVDDMDLDGRDLSLAVLDAHANIEVRIFNPFSRNLNRVTQFITRFGSVTRRMHNKSFTVDNQATILGGRNIGNEYFEADPDLAFGDLDVMGIGPVPQKVSDSFDLYWNNELTYPAGVLRGEAPKPEEIEQHHIQLQNFIAEQADSIYVKALEKSTLAQKIKNNQTVFRWGQAHVVYDLPEKVQEDFDQTQLHLSSQLNTYLNNLERELTIFSPYFVPGKAGTQLLTGLAQKGARVRILTNSLSSNDVGIVHAGYAKYRKALLRGGVELYEMNKQLSSQQRKDKRGVGGSSKASLHAKSFVLDRQQLFIGSLNLDPRSLLQNTEIGVIIDQPEIAGKMADWFDQGIESVAFRLELIENSNGSESIRWHGMVDETPTTFDVDPYTGFWQRLGIGCMSLLPIESQL